MKRKIISIIFILFLFTSYLYAQVQVSNDNSNFNSWPSITTLHDGSILASYSVGTSHGFTANRPIKIRKSTDGGTNWSNLATITPDSGRAYQTPAILEWDNGGTWTLMIAYLNELTYNTSKIEVRLSTDGGTNWGSAIELASGLVTTNYYVFGMKGRPILLSSNKIMVPWMAIYLSNGIREYMSLSTDLTGTAFNSPIAGCSGGYTSYYEMSESAILELKTSGSYSGAVINLVRKDADDGNSGWYKCLSTNYGATWGSKADSGLTAIVEASHANPADIIRITGDTIITAFDLNRGGYGGNYCSGVSDLDVYIRYSTAENADITWNASDILIKEYTGLSYCDGGYTAVSELTSCGDLGFVYYKATSSSISDIWFVSKTRAELGLPTTCGDSTGIINLGSGGTLNLGSGGTINLQ
jgi:hypothetical protein